MWLACVNGVVYINLLFFRASESVNAYTGVEVPFVDHSKFELFGRSIGELLVINHWSLPEFLEPTVMPFRGIATRNVVGGELEF